MDKKGDEIFAPAIMFWVLTLIVIGSLSYFVWNSSSGAIVYEQAYAKEIGLLLDNAQPNMTILIDMKEGLEIYGEKNLDSKDLSFILDSEGVEKIVSIENNRVTVSLLGFRGYSFQFFTDYKIEESFDEKGYLVVRIYDE
ncbi:hypothetical protein CO038_03075 [Candidatus Pacearchaeota archaeon CG_4_9_14_0_2_um_filter_39_13]|nr:hypothetical protein [Candidatus Pacearchaeota archaeon]OIO42148.1 MAG: hypothetical protein AUJ64_04230 [Candidatus Pacearchaeota archaeon CG1_02_39_14]PJC44549.1 MAG: hypothetical protein CO038_03075 [Candidatus Pacearchaeota archaeon CG_4_9_14_0_2_um_filter_39_13]